MTPDIEQQMLKHMADDLRDIADALEARLLKKVSITETPGECVIKVKW